MKRPRFRIRHQSRRGTATVEFAFVAPAFFLMVYAAVSFGSLVMVKNVLTASAADGARECSVGGTAASAIAAVESRLENGGVNVEEVQVTLIPSNPQSAAAGDTVAVRVTVPAANATWLDTGLLPLGFDIIAECTQIKE